MRKVIEMLLAVLLLPVMMGCSNDPEEMEPAPLGTKPYNKYYLYVKFTDKHGKNPVETLGNSDTSVHRSYDIYSINPDSYVMSYSTGDKEYNRYPAYLCYSIIDGEKYLNFEHSHWGKVENKRTYYLQCEQLFMDKERHVLSVEHEEAVREGNTKCVRFTLDGVEYAVDDDDRVVVKL